MEITGITNYSFEEFLILEENEREFLVGYLELLEPIQAFDFDDQLIFLKELSSLSFGEVNNVRDYLNYPTPESLAEIVNLITGLSMEQAFQIPIIEFYSIINTVNAEANVLATMESNELSGDIDADWIMADGSQKMSKFGVLNTIDALANGDITKWELIENLPYWTVITKLRMNKEMAGIQKAIASIQKQRQNSK